MYSQQGICCVYMGKLFENGKAERLACEPREEEGGGCALQRAPTTFLLTLSAEGANGQSRRRPLRSPGGQTRPGLQQCTTLIEYIYYHKQFL